jgi:hypothetical protein
MLQPLGGNGKDFGEKLYLLLINSNLTISSFGNVGKKGRSVSSTWDQRKLQLLPHLITVAAGIADIINGHHYFQITVLRPAA